MSHPTDRTGAGTAVVTGAGGALGAAVVRALRDAGTRVVAVDRSLAALEHLPTDVDRETCDLADPVSVDELFARLSGSGARVGAVVHTVGAFRGGSIADSTIEDYRTLVDANLGTAWWVSRAAAIAMADTGGAIVHVGARNGVEALPGAAAYGVSKAAIIHLTRTLDAELRSASIRVNAVLPGLIDTPANRASLPPETMARAVRPEAIAAVIAFLVSADATPVSGAVIPVYGAGTG
jgi:NAD(P)-dependent dehydrogenase (short-subunit alcohol dehydrogenase family)